MLFTIFARYNVQNNDQFGKKLAIRASFKERQKHHKGPNPRIIFYDLTTRRPWKVNKEHKHRDNVAVNSFNELLIV